MTKLLHTGTLTRSLIATCLMASALLAISTTSARAGDPAAGKEKSQSCAACHGEDGNSTIAMNPILAGQYADYLEEALRQYRSGARQNPIMAGMAEPLSDEDIEDLAAYYASQEGLQILPDGPAE